MFKNTASQKLRVFAFDSTTNLPKTGDAATVAGSAEYANTEVEDKKSEGAEKLLDAIDSRVPAETEEARKRYFARLG